MTTQMRNGRPSLATQIDRLDSLIDGFADALSGSVSEAVQQGMADLRQPLWEAARHAIREALADPALWPTTMIQGRTTTTPSPSGQPGPLVQLATWLENAAKVAVEKGRVWWQAGRTQAQRTSQELLAFLMRAWQAVVALFPLVWLLRWHIVVAAGASVELGVLMVVAGPAVALVLGMAGGFALVLLGLIVANLWFSHMVRLPSESRSEAACSQPSAGI